MNTEQPESHVPLLIEIQLQYNNYVNPPFEADFLYLNDEEISISDINHLFKKILDMPSLSAIEYGLPQLAPVDFIEQAKGDELPYTSVLSIKGLDKMGDDDHLINMPSDLLKISSVYQALLTQTPTLQYRGTREAFLLSLAEDLTAQLSGIETELNVKNPLSDALLLQIKSNISPSFLL
jgi:hypothetical protein